MSGKYYLSRFWPGSGLAINVDGISPGLDKRGGNVEAASDYEGKHDGKRK
jgi:hypothetical protein